MFLVCRLVRGIFEANVCSTYIIYDVNNLKAEGRIVIRGKIYQWSYRAISVKLVILLN